MVPKHHQEEISGPSDLVEDALNASELPRPKRARILSRKAQENREQNSTVEVPSRSSPTVPPTGPSNSPPTSSSIGGLGDTVPKQRQPPQRQQSSQNKSKKTGDRKTKEHDK